MPLSNVQDKRLAFDSALTIHTSDPSNQGNRDSAKQAIVDYIRSVKEYQKELPDIAKDTVWSDDGVITPTMRDFARNVLFSGVYKANDNTDGAGGISWHDPDTGKIRIVATASDTNTAVFNASQYAPMTGMLVPINGVVSWKDETTRQISDLLIETTDDVYFELEFSPVSIYKQVDELISLVGFGTTVDQTLVDYTSPVDPVVGLVGTNVEGSGVYSNKIFGTDGTTTIEKTFDEEYIQRESTRIGISYRSNDGLTTIYIPSQDGSSIQTLTVTLTELRMYFVILCGHTGSRTSAGLVILRNEQSEFVVNGNGVVPTDYIPLSDATYSVGTSDFELFKDPDYDSRIAVAQNGAAGVVTIDDNFVFHMAKVIGGGMPVELVDSLFTFRMDQVDVPEKIYFEVEIDHSRLASLIGSNEYSAYCTLYFDENIDYENYVIGENGHEIGFYGGRVSMGPPDFTVAEAAEYYVGTASTYETYTDTTTPKVQRVGIEIDQTANTATVYFKYTGDRGEQLVNQTHNYTTSYQHIGIIVGLYCNSTEYDVADFPVVRLITDPNDWNITNPAGAVSVNNSTSLYDFIDMLDNAQWDGNGSSTSSFMFYEDSDYNAEADAMANNFIGTNSDTIVFEDYQFKPVEADWVGSRVVRHHDRIMTMQIQDTGLDETIYFELDFDITANTTNAEMVWSSINIAADRNITGDSASGGMYLRCDISISNSGPSANVLYAQIYSAKDSPDMDVSWELWDKTQARIGVEINQTAGTITLYYVVDISGTETSEAYTYTYSTDFQSLGIQMLYDYSLNDAPTVDDITPWRIVTDPAEFLFTPQSTTNLKTAETTGCTYLPIDMTDSARWGGTDPIDEPPAPAPDPVSTTGPSIFEEASYTGGMGTIVYSYDGDYSVLYPDGDVGSYVINSSGNVGIIDFTTELTFSAANQTMAGTCGAVWHLQPLPEGTTTRKVNVPIELEVPPTVGSLHQTLLISSTPNVTALRSGGAFNEFDCARLEIYLSDYEGLTIRGMDGVDLYTNAALNVSDWNLITVWLEFDAVPMGDMSVCVMYNGVTYRSDSHFHNLKFTSNEQDYIHFGSYVSAASNGDVSSTIRLRIPTANVEGGSGGNSLSTYMTGSEYPTVEMIQAGSKLTYIESTTPYVYNPRNLSEIYDGGFLTGVDYGRLNYNESNPTNRVMFSETPARNMKMGYGFVGPRNNGRYYDHTVTLSFSDLANMVKVPASEVPGNPEYFFVFMGDSVDDPMYGEVTLSLNDSDVVTEARLVIGEAIVTLDPTTPEVKFYISVRYDAASPTYSIAMEGGQWSSNGTITYDMVTKPLMTFIVNYDTIMDIKLTGEITASGMTEEPV